MRERDLCRLLYTFERDIWLTVGDVVAHRVVKEDRVLRDLADELAHAVEGEIANVMSVEGDASGCDVEEARNEFNQRGFARSAWTYERKHFAARNDNIDLGENEFFFCIIVFLVAEADVVEDDGVFELFEDVSVLLLRHFILRVEELEDVFAGAERLLKAVVEECKLAHRIVEREDGKEKRNKGSGRHFMGDNAQASDPEQESDGYRTDRIHQWRRDGLDAYRFEVGTEEAARGCTEARHLPAFHAEGLHDAVARDGFIQDVLDLCELVLAASSRLAHATTDPPRRRDDDGNEKQKDPRHAATNNDRDRDHKNEGEDLLEKFTQHARHRHLDTLDVIDECGKQRTGAMFLEERDRPAQDRVVEVVAKVCDHAEAGIVHKICTGVVANSLDHRRDHQRKRNNRPGVVEVMRNEVLQIDVPVCPWNVVNENTVGRSVRREDVVKDWLDQENAERSQRPHNRHQDDGQQRKEQVGAEIGEQAQDASHRANSLSWQIDTAFILTVCARLCLSGTLQAGHIAVRDVCPIVMRSEAFFHLLRNGHRAMLASGAPEGDGKVALPFLHVVRQKKEQKLFYALQKLFRLRKVHHVLSHAGVLSGERAELRDEVRIGKKAYVEDQVGVRGDAIFETETGRGDQQTTVLIATFKLLEDMRTQFVHIKFAGVDQKIGHVTDWVKPRSLGANGTDDRLSATQRVRTTRLRVAANKDVVRSFKIDHRRRQDLAHLLQDGGKALYETFANIDTDGGATDLPGAADEIGEARYEFQGEIVDGVKTKIFKGLESGELACTGDTGKKDEFPGLLQNRWRILAPRFGNRQFGIRLGA